MEQSKTATKAPAVEKAFAVLEYVGRMREASFTEIFTALGLPKSSTHYLIDSLVHLGALRSVEKNRYVLGLRLFELGTLAIRNRPIQQEARPLMQELSEKVGLVCHLGTLEGEEAVYLVKSESRRSPVRVDSWEGRRISLHSSSLGKVLLAWKPSEEIERVLHSITMPATTATTITDKDAFRAHLADVREKGWATDNGEDIPEINCFAAPIRNRRGDVIYALSITGTASQIAAQPQEFFLDPLIRCAQDIGQTLN